MPGMFSLGAWHIDGTSRTHHSARHIVSALPRQAARVSHERRTGSEVDVDARSEVVTNLKERVP
jgi:hypothetical protein